MDFDRQSLSRYVPLVLPVAVLVAGWMFLIQPRLGDTARTRNEIETLQQQLAHVRASVANPLAPEPAVDAGARFEEQVATGDPTSELLEQLARLAAAARVSNLLIETRERVTVDANTGRGPQVVGGTAPDPRFSLFDVPLAYSPVTMSFDAEYERAGTLLWSLRDLATTVEIQDFEARPIAEEPTAGGARRRKIHVSLTLFAYSRERLVALSGGPGVLR